MFGGLFCLVLTPPGNEEVLEKGSDKFMGLFF